MKLNLNYSFERFQEKYKTQGKNIKKNLNLKFLKKFNSYIILEDESETKKNNNNSNQIKETESHLEKLIDEFLFQNKTLNSLLNLEDIISNIFNPKAIKSKYFYLSPINHIKNPHTITPSSETDPVSCARIFYVPGSYLPPNVLGMFVPSTNTIYVSTDQSPHQIEVTKHHEIYHARYGSDEVLAEEYGNRMAA